MPKVSIIIPVYNVEQYLRECLDSVVNQTLKDIEIICVNDGSTDSSLEILKEYAQKDNRIIIIDKENTGAGDSRNQGLDIATGEYFICFDSDDYFSDLSALNNMYNNAILNNSDITVCGCSQLEQETGNVKIIPYNIESRFVENNLVFNPKDYAKYSIQIFVGWPWDKLYKREFVLRKGLKYQNLRHSNDTSFVLSSVCLADKISIIKDSYIHHRKHKTSLAATRTKAPDCFYLALKQLQSILKKHSVYELYKQSFINYILHFSYWHISTIGDSKSSKIMISKLKQLWESNNINKYDEAYFYNKQLLQQCKRICKDESSVLNKIFSVVNSKDKKHKVITVMGIKIKIRKGTNNAKS